MSAAKLIDAAKIRTIKDGGGLNLDENICILTPMQRRWCVLPFACGIAAAVCSAAQPTNEQLKNWVAANLGTNRGLLDECGVRKGTFVSWEMEERASFTEQELASLKAAVAGKPEHPDAWIVKAEENRRKNGPDRSNYDVFLDGNDAWRFSTTIGTEFTGDLVYSPRQSWYHGDGVLKLFDPAAVASGKDTDQLPQADLNVFRPILTRFFAGELPMWEAEEYQAVEPSITGDKWTIKIRSKESQKVKLEALFTGHWLKEQGRGLVDSLTYVRNDYKPDTVGERVEFDGWVRDDALGTWRASTITHRRRTGNISRVFHWKAGGVDQARVSALMQPPTLDSADPLRTARITKVFNYTTGKVVARTPEGVATSRMEPRLGTTYEDETSWVRYAGWASAGFLVLGLVYWRVRAGRA